MWDPLAERWADHWLIFGGGRWNAFGWDFHLCCVSRGDRVRRSGLGTPAKEVGLVNTRTALHPSIVTALCTKMQCPVDLNQTPCKTKAIPRIQIAPK